MDQLPPAKRKIIFVYVAILFILIVILWVYFFRLNLQKAEQNKKGDSGSFWISIKADFSDFKEQTKSAKNDLQKSLEVLKQVESATTTPALEEVVVPTSTANEFTDKIKDKLSGEDSATTPEVKK
jgi:biopolymer transport protein ExbD